MLVKLLSVLKRLPRLKLTRNRRFVVYIESGSNVTHSRLVVYIVEVRLVDCTNFSTKWSIGQICLDSPDILSSLLLDVHRYSLDFTRSDRSILDLSSR